MNTKKWMIVGIVSLVAGASFYAAENSEAAHDEHSEAAHDEHDDHAGHNHAAPTAKQAPVAHVVEEEEHDDHAGHSHAEPGAKKTPVAQADAGHDEDEDEENVLHLTPEQRKRFGIVLGTASAGTLRNEIRLSGEISFNEDRLSHLSPRVAGIVREVHKTIGDSVKTGEVLAVIDSRELADAKADYLAAKARAALAEKMQLRERALREQKVTSEQELLDAEQTLAEAQITLRSLEQKLYALGLSEQIVAALDDQPGKAITRYEICSPIDGIISAKHISLGESLEADADIFTIVDTDSVWINLAVHARHLTSVHKGNEVLVRSDHDETEQQGHVAMVSPFVDKMTRSATARVILDNTEGLWVPGTFATGFITASADELPVVVPRSAVQSIEGRDVVFIEHEGEFEMASVSLGRSDSKSVEIKSGLTAGTPYVSEGAFELKATVVTSALDAHAGHGH